MTAAWVAATVRARALCRGRLGGAGVRALAQEESLRSAVATLQQTPYGRDLRAADDLATAQHAVAATLLWRLRVLAGWAPRHGAQLVRVLAAGFELANVDDHMARLEGSRGEPPYVLGTLETAWTRLAGTRTMEELRETLAASAWGDPGAAAPREVHLSMALAWAERVAGLPVSAAGEWARAGAALLLVREALLSGRAPQGRTADRAAHLLGPAAVAALDGPTASPTQVTGRLPRSLRWLWADVTGMEDLWRAEATWWRRLGDDGSALLRSGGYGPDPVVGAVALLTVDAWRTRAALEVAARHGPVPVGGGAPLEVFDELA